MRTKQQSRQQGGNSLGSFAVDLITSLGGRPTPAAQRLFNSWQRWEGGWSNNAAAFNPLNLTAPGSGFRTINEVGVVAMPSYQEGVRRTADLLTRKYPALANAFRTGQVDFSNPQVQANLNMWLSGKATPGMTPYVSKIAKSFGANVPLSQAPLPSPPGAAPGAAAPSFQLGPPKFQGDLFRSQIRNAFLQGGGRIDLGSMPSFLRSSFVQEPVPIPNAAPPPGAAGPLAAPSPTYKGGGKGISLPATFKQTHETSNLGWPAIDIMGKPGTPVRTPMGGTILRHGSAQGGEALYLDTNGDGEGDYWLGHVTQMAPVGSTVKPGQVIAYISPDHPRPHAHWARR